MAQRVGNSRLKVYCTQIGFHSWVVAAPNQKAALEAWDVKENLFAIGAAKVVTDKTAIALAIKTPGKAVTLDAKHDLAKATRVVQLADHRRAPARPHPAKAHPTRSHPARSHPARSHPAKAAAKRKKPADRSTLDRAEDALDAFQKRAVRERAAMLRQQRALDREAEEMEETLGAEEERLTEALEQARRKFEADAS